MDPTSLVGIAPPTLSTKKMVGGAGERVSVPSGRGLTSRVNRDTIEGSSALDRWPEPCRRSKEHTALRWWGRGGGGGYLGW